MPESSEVRDARRCSVECRSPPLRPISQSGPLLRDSNKLGSFCTENNLQECLSLTSQEVSALGLWAGWSDADGASQLNVVALLNCMYELIQLHHRSLRRLDNMEVERRQQSSNLDYLRSSNAHLEEELDRSKRQTTALLEKERQLQLKLKSLQNGLKNKKEEVQKLQSIVSSRACQYNHEMKRREREFSKLKERLNQLLADRKDKKQAIDVLNNIGRADGKRSLWKTEKTEAKHEGAMYRTLLSDYDRRDRDLVLENVALTKEMQRMQKEMEMILVLKGEQEEEEELDSSAEPHRLHARDQLTHSVRLQWKELKSCVDSRGSRNAENCEEDMERLKLEIQQSRDYIQTQQQLLQKQLGSAANEDSTLLQGGGSHMLRDREGLDKEWRGLQEQRKSFERERRNFTEANIRLSHERKIFEEDRATWLQQQFLSLSPFGSSKQLPLARSAGASSMAHPEVSPATPPEMPNGPRSDSASTTSSSSGQKI